ncbi:MAG: outer membrane beta-barrel protein, partial [Flavobacteriaceae bacterium]|nr:outer membrane beta-barrel protein [Flavobacteriaceae bacterium]
MRKNILTLVLISLFSCFSYAQSITEQISDKEADTLESDTLKVKEIQEILIKARKKRQFSDHANYTFDKEALEKARHSKDLLTTLPELQLDPESNTLKSTKGGTVLFLVNGIEASDNQVKSIAPTNIVRVEYFDIPPARYSQRADIVVNIITRNPEVGYSYGADVISALTTGFVNSAAYAGYTKGRNDFGFEYYINLRDYDNRIVQKSYEYDLNNIHYRSDETQKDHFGYTNQNIALRYANIVSEKYTFQSKLIFNINSNFNHGIGNSVFTKDLSLENHSTIHNSGSNYTAPTLDLYYSKNLGKKDELSLNLIGSYYNTKSRQFDHEWITETEGDVFNNDMNLKAKQTGIVGEIAHIHTFEKGKLSSGYRITNTNISNNLVNLLGTSDYSVTYLTQYLYTEFSGKKDKFSYRLGVGVTNIHNKSAEITQDDWTINPKLVLSYSIANNQSIRLSSDYTSKSPEADALSSNVVQTVPNIYKTGNPYLKPSHMFRNNFVYSFNNKFFDFNLTPFYYILYKDITQFYVFDDELNGYTLTNDNSKYTRQAGIQFSGSIKPFGNSLLTIKPFLQLSSILLKKEDGTEITNDYIRNFFTISSEYKNFSVQYQFNIPVYALNGAFLSINENASHFLVNYKMNNWTFSTGIIWLGMPSEYKTKSLPESLVDYTAHTQIFNNKNMAVLGLSFDFS